MFSRDSSLHFTHSTPLSDLKVLNSKPSRSRLDPGDSGVDCSSSKSIQRSLLIAFKRHPNSTPIWKRRFSRIPCASSGSAKPFSMDNNLAWRTLFQKCLICVNMLSMLIRCLYAIPCIRSPSSHSNRMLYKTWKGKHENLALIWCLRLLRQDTNSIATLCKDLVL